MGIAVCLPKQENVPSPETSMPRFVWPRAWARWSALMLCRPVWGIPLRDLWPLLVTVPLPHAAVFLASLWLVNNHTACYMQIDMPSMGGICPVRIDFYAENSDNIHLYYAWVYSLFGGNLRMDWPQSGTIECLASRFPDIFRIDLPRRKCLKGAP